MDRSVKSAAAASAARSPSPSRRRRAMHLSLWEGLLFSLMVGAGEFYFLAFAIRLGASHVEQALVITLPLCVGTVGPWLTLWAIDHFGRRKPPVLIGVAVQAAVLVSIVTLDRTIGLSPAAFIALVCMYQVGGQGAGTAWSSWYGDLVPATLRGRYFAGRNRIVHVGTCLAMVAGGLSLQALEPALAGQSGPQGGFGFALVFGVAAGCRLVSCVLLALAPELELESPPPTRIAIRQLAYGDAMRPARRLILTAALLQVSVYVASPFFGPYMLEELRFSYAEYMLASITVVVIKLAALPAWGRAVDRYGARSVYLLAIALVAVIPVPWLFASGLVMVMVAQSVSGFAWSGQELGHFSMLLDSTQPRFRLPVFAAANFMNGVAQVGAGLLGSLCLAVMDGRFAVLFALSWILRTLVAAAAPAILPPRIGVAAVGRRQLLVRILGIRPSGGLEHRPLSIEPAQPRERRRM